MATQRPLSNLRYERIQDGAGSPRLITLHDHDQTGTAYGELARSVAPDARIVGLESYKGVYVGREITGFTWYPGPAEQPPPVFFGDSLIEIEKFLLDELDRQTSERPERSFLFGVRQGGVMALAAGLAAPDTLSGIIALEAMLPPVAGWSPPLAPLEALPVLIAGAHPLAQRRIGVLCGESLAERLRQWGADPIVLPDLPEPERTAAIAGWLARQRPRYGGPQENDS
jgi:predicted esterase